MVRMNKDVAVLLHPTKQHAVGSGTWKSEDSGKGLETGRVIGFDQEIKDILTRTKHMTVVGRIRGAKRTLS